MLAFSTGTTPSAATAEPAEVISSGRREDSLAQTTSRWPSQISPGSMPSLAGPRRRWRLRRARRRLGLRKLMVVPCPARRDQRGVVLRPHARQLFEKGDDRPYL